MLSYQHGYHAGCFADVVKHFTLSRMLDYLVSRDKPLFYLETHAGRGIYDLKAAQANKTGEYLEGIDLLWKQKDALPDVFSGYMEQISKLNSGKDLRYYPGSPLIAIDQLRDIDRLYCCELHPREFTQLEFLPKQDKRVHYSHTDGIKSMTSLLPPPERRGLVFIDPSYELKDEYKTVPQAIKAACQRFPTGVFCLWYPIIDNRLHEQVMRGMRAIEGVKHLRIEFELSKNVQSGMRGCGLWIINPPWVLAEEMKTGLAALCKLLNPGKSSFIVEML